MAKNTTKFLSYKEAWRRINDATAKGFYFEVVTLCESIISDRLLSYIRGVDKRSKASINTPFANLIREWRELLNGDIPWRDALDLGAEVDAWRKERNTIIHGLTKSEPGTPTLESQPFITRAEQTAKTGAKLARYVSGWHRQELRAHRKSLRSTGISAISSSA
jgi:hypothetical protein